MLFKKRKREVLSRIKEIYGILQERIPSQETIDYIMEKLSLAIQAGYKVNFNDKEFIIGYRWGKPTFILKIYENKISTEEICNEDRSYEREIEEYDGITIICSQYRIKNISNGMLLNSESRTRLEYYSDGKLDTVSDSVLYNEYRPFGLTILSSKYHMIDDKRAYEERKIKNFTGNCDENTVEYYLYDDFKILPLTVTTSINYNGKKSI